MSLKNNYQHTQCIILAAGRGTRMKSELPKVLHHMAGVPMAKYAVDTAWGMLNRMPVVVVGYKSEEVIAALGSDRSVYVNQGELLGTGHAVKMGLSGLDEDTKRVIVWYADMPLLTAQSLLELADKQIESRSPVAMSTVITEEKWPYGRIIRGAEGNVLQIVEEVEATPEQMAIKELNVGAYCFDRAFLENELPKLRLTKKGEYFLTDLIEHANKLGLRVEPVPLSNPHEAVGVNTPEHLEIANRLVKKQ